MEKNARIWLILILIITAAFVAGCTTNLKMAGGGGLSKNKCNSTFCYCERCDIGNWTIVNKSKSANNYTNIVTEGDCANYCAHYNVTKGEENYDKGYESVCSDIVVLTTPTNCNCAPGTRCCMTGAVLSPDKMQCIDIDTPCIYAWAPDYLCNSTY
ncbi:MAG: hypothetical protein NTZ02_00210 [Candidatus Woesearchaeota archaeon]|nr:hypothetical protein [Candidatus Woesearchaeota archaeon]